MSAGVELLSPDEHRAIELTAELVSVLARIVGDDPRTRAGDVHELVIRVHGIQHMIMSQAAARAYPDRYRLLGGPPPPAPPSSPPDGWHPGTDADG